jgi:hypothetical protein
MHVHLPGYSSVCICTACLQNQTVYYIVLQYTHAVTVQISTLLYTVCNLRRACQCHGYELRMYLSSLTVLLVHCLRVHSGLPVLVVAVSAATTQAHTSGCK